MFNSTNISATFNPSTIPNSKAFGYGSIDFAGVSVNYSVYPSQYGLGIMVALPSRPKMKNGVQERDAQGRPAYNNEVFIRDASIRALVDEAVINAMANKGVYTAQTAAAAQQAGQYVGQVVQSTPVAPQMNRSFDNPVAAPQASFTPPPVQQHVQQSVPQFQQPTHVAVPPVVTPPVQQQVSSTAVWDEDLPF